MGIPLKKESAKQRSNNAKTTTQINPKVSCVLISRFCLLLSHRNPLFHVICQLASISSVSWGESQFFGPTETELGVRGCGAGLFPNRSRHGSVNCPCLHPAGGTV